MAQALRMAAQAVGRTQTAAGPVLPADQEPARRPGAITATAHKLARLVYRMLKYGTEYVARSLADYEAQVREKLERSLRRKAHGAGLRPGAEAGGLAVAVVTAGGEARRPVSILRDWSEPGRAEEGARGRLAPDARSRRNIRSITAHLAERRV